MAQKEIHVPHLKLPRETNLCISYVKYQEPLTYLYKAQKKRT